MSYAKPKISKIIKKEDEPLYVFGVIIPPSKLSQSAPEINSQTTITTATREYQEFTWNHLKTVINDLVSKVNMSNLKQVVAELLAENIIRGKGMLYESCIKYQDISHENTHVFATLVSLLNNRFPVIGWFFMQRIFRQFKQFYNQDDKDVLTSWPLLKFIAHLTNLKVIEILIANDVLLYCLLKETSDYVQLAAQMFNELRLPKKEFRGVDERFRCVRKCFRKSVCRYQLDQNVVDMVEKILANWDSKFETMQEHTSLRPEILDWLNMDGLKCKSPSLHSLNRKYNINPAIALDNFNYDPLFLERDTAYKILKSHVLTEGYWQRNTPNSNKWNWRKHITVPWKQNYPEVSSNRLLEFLRLGEEMELCLVLLEECLSVSYDGTLDYISLAEYLCKKSKVFQEKLSKCFLVIWLMSPGILPEPVSHFSKFYAELLIKDVVSWHILAYVQLTPGDLTLNSKVFLHQLFMVLKVKLTEKGLLNRFLDPELQDVYEAFFPKDEPTHARYALDFFKSMKLHQFVKGIKNFRKLQVQ